MRVDVGAPGRFSAVTKGRGGFAPGTNDAIAKGHMTAVLRRAALLLLAALVGACGHVAQIPGTTVADNQKNRSIIELVEQYKLRLQDRNVEGLMLLASDRYREDSGTPGAEDDYGYQELQRRLAKTLARVKSVRYEIKYRSIRFEAELAHVEVYITGAFELASESGDRYRRVSDYHRFVLEPAPHDKWKFVAGM
jgi:hypothetical protein